MTDATDNPRCDPPVVVIGVVADGGTDDDDGDADVGNVVVLIATAGVLHHY